MNDLIVIAVVLVIVGLALGYVIKTKKSGKKCIGCPENCHTSNKCCSCSCSNNANNNNL